MDKFFKLKFWLNVGEFKLLVSGGTANSNFVGKSFVERFRLFSFLRRKNNIYFSFKTASSFTLYCLIPLIFSLLDVCRLTCNAKA